ncbi:MAG: hypothetical protein HY208_06505 [Nitrospirae bacterium]|nr:hypothetical protein [Nitrospirota bacterium]
MKPLPRPGLLAAIIASLPVVLIAAWVAGPFRPPHQASFNPADLSSTERAQLAEAVLTIAEAPQETMEEARKRAWEILRPHRVEPAAVRRGLEPIFLKIGQGPRLFWTDAQQAIAEHRPVKSAARTQWEAELMGDGWLTLAHQRRYDEFMDRLARDEPIESTHGMDIAVDRRMADAIRSSLDEDELRRAVAELLTPPQ